MAHKKVVLEGVGEILLERSPRAKHITLSVKPFKGVRIAVPQGVTFQDALAVAQLKMPWLKKHLGRMALIEKEISAQSRHPIPDRQAARRLIVQRLDHLASLHGFAYHKVFVRNQKTRWGSCSYQNNINLNVNLVRLPETLMDYTILHELVHTRIKHHGRNFWEELAKYIPDPKKLDQELNRHWILLMPPAG